MIDRLLGLEAVWSLKVQTFLGDVIDGYQVAISMQVVSPRFQRPGKRQL